MSEAERVTLRPYRPEDRSAIDALCTETGLRGQLAQYFCDSELFCRVWLAPFLEGEPENAVVVEDENGIICGYLVASLRSGFAWRVVRYSIPYVCLVIFRYLRGKYKWHPPSERFVRWLVFRMWREVPSFRAGMTAHFHFNLRAEKRGGRVGWLLVDDFEERVRKAGLPGWSGVFFVSDDDREWRRYARIGLELGEKRRCSLFDCPVYLVTVWKTVGQELRQTLLARW